MKTLKNVFGLLLTAALFFTACEEDKDEVAASFSVSPSTTITAGDTLWTNNTSVFADSYAWDFGNGTTSTEENPYVVYKEEGTYTITLTAEGDGSTSTDTEVITVGKPTYTYILNYGSFENTVSTVTSYNYEENTVAQGAYKLANNNVDMTSNVQYAAEVDNKIYFMGNSTDQIFETDLALLQTTNAVTADIAKPRYCVSDGDYLYISCWGGEIWYDQSISYIAKFNKTTRSVEEKIALPGGPEGLAIANGKLYAALNYTDSIAVMDLSTQTFEYIKTPAVTSYFVKDANENLYVSLISSYSVPATTTGIGLINTSDNTMETFTLDGIAADYGSYMAFNNDESKLYVVTSTGWPDYTGAIKVFNVASKSFEATNFLENVDGLNSISVNPKTDEVYVMVSAGSEAAGELQVYDASAALKTTVTTGISPKWTLFIED